MLKNYNFIPKVIFNYRDDIRKYKPDIFVEQNGFIVQHKLIDGAYQIANVYKNNDDYVSVVFPDLKINLKDIFE